MAQTRESTWLNKLYTSSSSSSISEDSSNVDIFDMLDAMEQGCAKEVTSAFTTPVSVAEGERHLTVERAANRRDFELLSEWGETLLIAKGNKDCTSFDIVMAGDCADQCAYRPGAAFTLQASGSEALADWTLASAKCEVCESCPLPLQECRMNKSGEKRVLAKFHQYQMDIGEGQAFCMDINIPEVSSEEGEAPQVWCPCCTGTACTPGMTLTSRRPKWSSKQKTLALDFHGRCKVASTKNFMLELPGSERRRTDVKLLFGKVSANSFNLDISQPFSLVQAFAAALSVSNWS
mmetsp:Transcript_69503/g.166608  ORF Transcript_69503/g.166608 Transcript_69503/m.166608 type:complete len:292 (-) Transcript_69503:268-1143(-)